MKQSLMPADLAVQIRDRVLSWPAWAGSAWFDNSSDVLAEEPNVPLSEGQIVQAREHG